MWKAEAPSNIALIKYMGKQHDNISSNISLSYTLNNFKTEVTLKSRKNQDNFINEIGLNPESIHKFLKHLNYIKNLTGCSEFFEVRSVNNFPHSAGIASSASSFAALTMCSFNAMCDIQGKQVPSREEMSQVSRRGSGSSCRSFFSPWCVWDGEYARKIDIKIKKLTTDLVAIKKEPKSISSSDAHKLVRSSLLFDGRAKRAEIRFEKLIYALNNDKWSEAYQICWEEFCDMNALFETSNPHFSYVQPETVLILSEAEKFWKFYNDGPIVTIDAGPNPHFLWRKDQKGLQEMFKNIILSKLPKVSFL